MTVFSVDFMCQLWICFHSLFHASFVTQQQFTIPCVRHDSISAINSIHHLSLSIHWRFQRLQWLCFHWPFMDQPWHSIFDNSMLQPCLYFCFQFEVSVVNSLMLSIPYVSCHSVLCEDFNVYNDSVFSIDLWFRRDIAFWHFHASAMTLFWLSIPYVRWHSVFSDDFKVYSDSVFSDV
jgi:hypothetical protein